jgi:hypothetical protein
MADLSRTPVTLIGASRGLGRVLAKPFIVSAPRCWLRRWSRPASRSWCATRRSGAWVRRVGGR